MTICHRRIGLQSEQTVEERQQNDNGREAASIYSYQHHCLPIGPTTALTADATTTAAAYTSAKASATVSASDATMGATTTAYYIKAKIEPISSDKHQLHYIPLQYNHNS